MQSKGLLEAADGLIPLLLAIERQAIAVVVEPETNVEVDIFIEGTFENSAGRQVDYSNEWVRNLKPGGTAEWEMRVFEPYKTCDIEISGVYES